MSAITVVEGLDEGLQLVSNLLAAAQTVNTAVQTAQANGTPVDFTQILSEEAQAENAVLAAIAAAKAQGR